MNRRMVTVWVIILLLVGVNVAGDLTLERNDVIVVDDEGDGDFTFIKDALSFANPGDTIKVYSGTYLESEIRILKDNITLLGVAYELGEGNDTGKPFINGNGTVSVIQVEACDVIVSNFKIENPWSKRIFACGIYIKLDYYPFSPKNVTISDCNISYSPQAGIYCWEAYAENITIINNHISHCNKNGIDLRTNSCIISSNIITDCGESGIYFGSFMRNVSGNKVKRCGIGIQFGGENNIVYGNDIESCDIGVRNAGWGSIIAKNNFKNYSKIGIWFAGTVGERFIDGYNKSRWIGNYWDTWNGIGPIIILGYKVLWLRRLFFLIPWIDFEWNPASEPYDIEVL